MAHRMALLMYYLIYQCSVSLGLSSASSKPDYKILNYCSNAPTKPENCVDLMCLGKNTSGTYEVFPADAPTKGYKVYCDQESNGGGWMVFQRRNDGELDFLRDWSAYRAGFGSVDDEFWLGNDRISQQTNAADSELLLTLQKTNGAKMTAQYSKFQLAPNTEKFKLSVGGYSGNAGDMLSSRSGSVFTTSDKPSASQEAADCSIDESAWYVYPVYIASY